VDYGYNSTAFERELRRAIEERRQELVAQVASGAGIGTMADYRRLIGYLSAFEEALQLMDEVKVRLLKKPE
jgi:hypothetical protein